MPCPSSLAVEAPDELKGVDGAVVSGVAADAPAAVCLRPFLPFGVRSSFGVHVSLASILAEELSCGNRVGPFEVASKARSSSMPWA